MPICVPSDQAIKNACAVVGGTLTAGVSGYFAYHAISEVVDGSHPNLNLNTTTTPGPWLSDSKALGERKITEVDNVALGCGTTLALFTAAPGAFVGYQVGRGIVWVKNKVVGINKREAEISRREQVQNQRDIEAARRNSSDTQPPLINENSPLLSTEAQQTSSS